MLLVAAMLFTKLMSPLPFVVMFPLSNEVLPTIVKAPLPLILPEASMVALLDWKPCGEIIVPFVPNDNDPVPSVVIKPLSRDVLFFTNKVLTLVIALL